MKDVLALFPPGNLAIILRTPGIRHPLVRCLSCLRSTGTWIGAGDDFRTLFSPSLPSTGSHLFGVCLARGVHFFVFLLGDGFRNIFHIFSVYLIMRLFMVSWGCSHVLHVKVDLGSSCCSHLEILVLIEPCVSGNPCSVSSLLEV